ncbi:MAG: hypothetical protein JST08_10655 [Actinobacteria bacterium]|nr:hypothetical protein [Actinomycetota bacterium]
MSRAANLRGVSFFKRESRRNPLQRLSDQRRSLALAGLAIGAVCSAAILRRRRHGEEVKVESKVQFDGAAPVAAPEAQAEPATPVSPPSPEPTPPAAQPAPEPSIESVEPPAADEPVEPPIAPVEPPAPIEQPAAEVSAPASGSEPEAGDAPRPINAAPATDGATAAEPATGELSAEEASILAVLAQSGRSDDDRTAIAVATSLERDTRDVTTVLRKLGAEGVVSGDLRTPSGEEIWAVTERGVRRLGAQS